jgi:hypothetical protein
MAMLLAPLLSCGPGGPAAAPSPAAGASTPLRVTRPDGTSFAAFEGAAARQAAEAECDRRGRRLSPSIYDRFEAGAWVYVEGCR